jgi:hypothetical protein
VTAWLRAYLLTRRQRRYDRRLGPCVCGCGRVEAFGWDGYHGYGGPTPERPS